MSNAKTGGNKKTSSQSDQNYWKRAQASKLHEVHRDRRIARHVKRCKTSLTKLKACNGLITPNFPKIMASRPIENVMFKSEVPEMRTFDEFGNVATHPMFKIVNGVVLDVLRVKK